MKQNKTKRIKKIGTYVFYVALTVFILALVLSFNDMDGIREVISEAKLSYVGIAVLCLLGYILLYPLSLCILTSARKCDISPLTTYNIAMTEHFFNGITPFATGGQPFQVYSFSRARVKASESTCLLLMNFMVFMLVTNGFAACSLFFFRRFVTTGPMTIISVVGFSINFFVLIMTFLLATNKGICRLICRFLDFLCRFRLLSKLLSPRVEGLKLYFVQVQEAFAALMKRKGHFLLALLSKICSMGLYYMTTFFILKALNVPLPSNDLFFIICGTSFAITMVVFLPTPGSSGGIELAFKDVFASITGGSIAVATSGMLIWRLLTYYLVMLISLAFYVVLEIRFAKKSKAKMFMTLEEDLDDLIEKHDGESEATEKEETEEIADE